MPREDSLSSQFDYLFEPLDVEESTDAATENEGSLSESAHGTSSPRGAAAPTAAPTPSPRQSQGSAAISPSTRAPISVAPETRLPFPNQGPRDGGGQNGGLLGGLL